MKKFLFAFLFILTIVEGAESFTDDEGVIILSSTNSTQSRYIVKTVDDALELTCFNKNNNISVCWDVPKHLQERVLFSRTSNGSSTVTISQLSENDSGRFKCVTHEGAQAPICDTEGICSKNNSSYAIVHLKVKRKSCLGFQCSPTLCILKRYVCDGRNDCLNKEDETSELCGPDPCLNKIKCPSGRCIPQEWCCIHVLNCTRKWDINCCPNNGRYSQDDSSIMRYLGSPQHYNDHILQQYSNSNSSLFPHSFGHFGLLQTLIHTVIGCALVLVVIGPIVAIGVCKLFMRQRSRRIYECPTLIVSPRLNPDFQQRSSCLTAVSYHPSLNNQIASGESYEPFTQDQELSDEHNNNEAVVLGQYGIIQPQGPPPYYEAVLSLHDDDEPPPYVFDNEDDQPCSKTIDASLS